MYTKQKLSHKGEKNNSNLRTEKASETHKVAFTGISTEKQSVANLIPFSPFVFIYCFLGKSGIAELLGFRTVLLIGGRTIISRLYLSSVATNCRKDLFSDDRTNIPGNGVKKVFRLFTPKKKSNSKDSKESGGTLFSPLYIAI